MALAPQPQAEQQHRLTEDYVNRMMRGGGTGISLYLSLYIYIRICIYLYIDDPCYCTDLS